ncbi:MAG: hypothetical protein KatS3mg101_0488 [Patescibacteria group bacterium]|nr:MAG: hypothetical protein KatS3mg101_0488 [Patescibacteria group bacterium]
MPAILALSMAQPSFAEKDPPYTSLSKTPALPNGKNNWYVTPVNIVLSSTDLGSGVSTINYRIDGGSWVVVRKSDTLNLAPNPSFEVQDPSSSINTQAWEAGLQDIYTTYSRDTISPLFDSTSIKIYANAAGVALNKQRRKLCSSQSS